MTGLLVVALLGQAQSCIAQTYQQTYAAPIQYQQQAYNQAYVEKTIFVAVEDPASFYGGLVGQAQRTEARAAQAQQVQASNDQKIDRLTVLVEQLQKRLEVQPNEQPLLPPKPSQAVPRPPLPSPGADQAEAAPPPPTVAQAGKRAQHPGLAVLAKSCAGCHGGSAAKGGGVILFAADGSFTAKERDDLERIEAAISSGRMPKRAKQPMSLKEYVAIRDFLTEQASGLALTINQRKRIR